jgi:hypothetical protein
MPGLRNVTSLVTILTGHEEFQVHVLSSLKICFCPELGAGLAQSV